MTVEKRKQYRLVCDHCGKAFAQSSGYDYAPKVEWFNIVPLAASRFGGRGWKRIDGLDVCPDCRFKAECMDEMGT